MIASLTDSREYAGVYTQDERIGSRFYYKRGGGTTESERNRQELSIALTGVRR